MQKLKGGKSYWRCGGNLECIIRIWDDGRETTLFYDEEDTKNPDADPIDINDILFYNVRSN